MIRSVITFDREMSAAEAEGFTAAWRAAEDDARKLDVVLLAGGTVTRLDPEPIDEGEGPDVKNDPIEEPE